VPDRPPTPVEGGWFAIANGNAGTAERAAVDAALSVLAEDAPTRLVLTDHADDLEGALDDAVGHRPVVVGGDGSLHLVVARLRARGTLGTTTLGLVPLGTGNDLARGVGLPLDPAEAARRVVTGTPHPMDLLVDDAGGVVVNAVHAGLGAAAAERADGLKDRLGALAYPLGTLLAGVRAEGWDLTVEVDGEVVHTGEPVLMVGVANGPSIGGGTLLHPGATPDDGRLEVVVVTATGPIARAAFGSDLRRSTHLERDDVSTWQGRSVRIHGEAVAYDGDGELEDDVVDRTYRVEAGAWSLLR
jgi:diacylglycerol kinase family enzyme